MKTNNFGLSLPKRISLGAGLTAGVLFLATLFANSAHAQFTFATAQPISGVWGAATNDNTGVIPDIGAPTIAGNAANAPIWYTWTAPQDGVVTLDTVGSLDELTFYPLDTVLGVFSGSSLTTLNQVAANDDLFPINNGSSIQSISTGQIIESGSADTVGLRGSPLFSYLAPFYGPSSLKFTAKGGQTYYIAVDTKPGGFGIGTGPLILNWAYKPSGVFRFASENEDFYTGLLLYDAAGTESYPIDGYNNAGNSTVLTYYQYNAQGVLVTVTRTAGSTGRMKVDYQTVDGSLLAAASLIGRNDLPALDTISTNSVTVVMDQLLDPAHQPPGTNCPGAIIQVVTNIPAFLRSPDYTPVSGTLVFDDNEMSKTILIPVNYQNFFPESGYPQDQTNRVFGVMLTNPQLDPAEAGDVPPPRVDPTFGLALIRILDPNADPYGPDQLFLDITNAYDPDCNPVTATVKVPTWYPTNNIFNFEKTCFRVPADVNDPNVSPWGQVTLWVERGGTNTSGETLHYRVNNYLGNDGDAAEERNNFFPLQPGSDYAVPTPAMTGVRGVNSDFVLDQGTVTFPGGSAAANFYQPITFTIPTNTLTKFNKDFKVQIYAERTVGSQTVPRLVGMINEATVTILFDDKNPPAGSVDELHNADFNSELALYSSQIPITEPPDSENPGVGFFGEVYCISLLPNGEAFIGGDFQSYNGNAQGCVALVQTNGQLDTSFSPGSGANAAVNAVAPSGSQFYAGGSFTSYDGNLVGRIVRLNADGTIDNAFNPGTGADATIRALAVLPNGEVLIGGDFTHFNNAPANYVALIRTDGTMDTSFNAGGTLSGPVYALALQGFNRVIVGGRFSVSGHIYQNIARLRLDGSLDGTFNPGTGADNVVHALAVQVEGPILAAGEFTHINGVALNRLARFNTDGSLDTANFFVGAGADATVFTVNPAVLTTETYVTNTTTGDITTNVTYSTTGIYIGGSFASYNGTHRLGFARLYANGTVDTTFMDTAYNQFAGLKRIYSYDQPAVLASVVESSGHVLIGGSFSQVGGGQANTNVCNTLDEELAMFYGFGYDKSFDDPNLWVEAKTRDGVRNRSGFARLIGGATPGPGNIGFKQTGYSANKSQTSLTLSLVRTNGVLGPVSANFSVQPGLAHSGTDYSYQGTAPIYWVASDWLTHPTRERSDGLSGLSGFLIDPYGLYLTLADSAINNLSKVTVSIIDNRQTSGDLNATFQLDNPNADVFYLGGQEIPLGGALGVSAATFTLVDDTSYPGTFGFSSPTFVATNLTPNITVLRSNGVFGVVSMSYSTSNGTAVAGPDYVGLTNKPLVFAQNVISNGFSVTIKDNGYVTNVEKTVNLRLANLGGTAGATFGISNAVLRIVNPNYQGYVTMAATNFTGTISSGVLTFVVNRVSGSLGTVTVQYGTTDGSAINGVDYVGATNVLTWNSGDVSPRLVNIPLLNPGTVGTNTQFRIALSNPTLNGFSTPALMGVISNATLTIVNDNSFGSIQFSSPTYLVNENGGYATVSVIRTGGAVGTISAHYLTSDGPAVNGVSYVATNGTINLASGQTAASFNIPILNDGVVDPSPTNFYFNVTLVGPGTLTNTVVRILDAQSYNQPPGSPDTLFNTNGMNGDVFGLALQSSGQMIAVGNFTAVGPVSEGRIARLNTDGSLDTTFLNGLSGAGAAINCAANQTDNRIIVGGAFTSINGLHRNYIARMMSDGTLDTSFNPGSGPDSSVNVAVETFIGGLRRVYIGGAFGSVNGMASSGIARLKADAADANNCGSPDNSFNIGSGADGQIYAIAVYPTNSIYAGKVVIGGSFAHFNGVAITDLARLNVDGTLDTSFNAHLGVGPNDTVRALAIQLGGEVLVGGRFTGFNGAALNHIARLHADGTPDASFATAVGSGADGDVVAIQMQTDTRILVTGDFAHFNGVTRSHVTRLLPTGATDSTVNFGSGANGLVDAIAYQPWDNRINLGGSFSQFNGLPHPGIVRLYGGSIIGSGAFTFATANFQADENGIIAPIVIQRSGGTSGTNADGSGSVSVHFATSNGTAAPNVNYLPVSTDVVFPAGEVQETVLVPVLDDFAITPDLTVNLALSNPTPPATNGVQSTATLTIVNVDSAVALSSGFYTVAKNTPIGVAVIDVLRLGGTNDPCTVDFATTTNGTAVIGTDYYPTNLTLTFQPGVSDIQVRLPIINNNLPEGNKTVTIVLTNAVNVGMMVPSNAVLTIIDTVAAPGQLYFAATNFTANAGNGYAYLPVVRTNGSSGTVSVSYSLVPGTAQPGLNYINTPGTLTFGPGVTTASVPVQLLNPPIVQGPVSVTVSLASPSGGATLTAPTHTTLTILNTNTGVIFQNATNFVRETNGYVPIYVQRLGGTNGNISVNYSTAAGTAHPGVNYTTISGTLNFAPNESLKAISLPLIDDGQVHGNLYLTMSFSSPSPGTLMGYPSNAVVFIQDAEAGISLTTSATNVFKSAGVLVLPVVCTNTAVEPVIVNSNVVPMSVHYATANGTAVAGLDYTAVSGTFYFTNGIGTNYIYVPIINNSQVTGDHSFTVSLSSPTAPAQLTPPSSAVVNIVDNNSGLSFSSPVYSVLKSGVAATITVTRSDNTNRNSWVNFATSDGTALAGLDYFATNGTFMFTNGETSKTFRVVVIANTAVQPDKTVLLQLSAPTNGFLIAPYAATLTIHDNSGSLVVPAGSTLLTESLIANGIIDPNERVSLAIALRASGGTNVNNVTATLLTTNGVTLPSGAQNYGSLTVNGPSVWRPFTFTAQGTNSQAIAATFALSSGAAPIGTAVFTYTLGTWTTTFANTNSIVIRDVNMASPYPSGILVSNVGGVLVKSTVTLTNLFHGYTKDISALVVSPAGPDTLLMGHAGNSSVTKITLTFDDAASTSLLQTNSLTSGTNKPTSYVPTTTFP